MTLQTDGPADTSDSENEADKDEDDDDNDDDDDDDDDIDISDEVMTQFLFFDTLVSDIFCSAKVKW